METITLARELGKKIQQTNEYQKAQEAKARNDLDIELQTLINEFNLKKIDFERKVGSDELEENEQREKNKEIMTLYNKIMSNPNMADYTAAKNELNGLMKQINSILIMSMNGADPETCDVSSCGGGTAHSGCSGCNGCG
ncbi:MAG: YlbF family regulator [Oscillospiraceae bacterium]|nr:YlbF family regulator [Oscillospiraceae bacterium]